MSKGDLQNGCVMNDQTTTFPWEHTQSTTIHLRRISLSLHSEGVKRRKPEHRRIISGVDFGRRDFDSVQRSARKSETWNRQTPHGETEPLWVSILGGVGIAIGTLACWILV